MADFSIVTEPGQYQAPEMTTAIFPDGLVLYFRSKPNAAPWSSIMPDHYKIPSEIQAAVAALKALEPVVSSLQQARTVGLKIVVPEAVEKAYVEIHGDDGQRFIDLLLGRTVSWASSNHKIFMKLEDDAKDSVQLNEPGEINQQSTPILPLLEQTIVDLAGDHLESYKHAVRSPYNHDWSSSLSQEYWMLNSLLLLGHLANSGLSDSASAQLEAIERELGKVDGNKSLVKGEPLFHLQLEGGELLAIHHVEKLEHEIGYATLLSIQQWEDGGTLLTVNDSLFPNPEALGIRAKP